MRKSVLVLALSGFGLIAGAAQAASVPHDTAIVIDASYANASGHHTSGNIFGINGLVTVPLSLLGNAAVQGDFGYHDVVSGGSHNNWLVGGTLFWAMDSTRFGVSSSYHSIDLGGGVTESLWNYHGALEWYPSDMFTLGAKVGGASGGLGLSGWFTEGLVSAYLTPDFVVSGSIDYAKDDNWTFFSHELDMTLQGEYLISHDTPISLYAGYTWSQAHVGFFSGTPNASIAFVGVKLYTDGGGSLVDHHRNGAAAWLGSFAPLSVKF